MYLESAETATTYYGILFKCTRKCTLSSSLVINLSNLKVNLSSGLGFS